MVRYQSVWARTERTLGIWHQSFQVSRAYFRSMLWWFTPSFYRSRMHEQSHLENKDARLYATFTVSESTQSPTSSMNNNNTTIQGFIEKVNTGNSGIADVLCSLIIQVLLQSTTEFEHANQHDVFDLLVESLVTLYPTLLDHIMYGEWEDNETRMKVRTVMKMGSFIRLTIFIASNRSCLASVSISWISLSKPYYHLWKQQHQNANPPPQSNHWKHLFGSTHVFAMLGLASLSDLLWRICWILYHWHRLWRMISTRYPKITRKSCYDTGFWRESLANAKRMSSKHATGTSDARSFCPVILHNHQRYTLTGTWM